MADLNLQLQGFQLTTAQIYYYFPDYPKLIQEFLWQDYDIAPRFPRLYNFLDFWTKDIDGKLHSVYVAKQKLLMAGDLKSFETEINC